MKDNYSWLDDVLDKYIPSTNIMYENQPTNRKLAKQTIISQIQIEKLSAKIEETEMLRDKIWAFLHVLPATMGDKQAINSIDYEFEEELTHLTEKLKELRR